MDDKFKKITIGAATAYGTHIGSSVAHRLAPSASGFGSVAASYGLQVGTAAVGAYLYAKVPSEKSLGENLVFGSLGGVALRFLAGVDALRFSESTILKGAQYILNGPAHLIGDSTIGYTTALDFKVPTDPEDIDSAVKSVLAGNSFENSCRVLQDSILSGMFVAELDAAALEVDENGDRKVKTPEELVLLIKFNAPSSETETLYSLVKDGLDDKLKSVLSPQDASALLSKYTAAVFALLNTYTAIAAISTKVYGKQLSGFVLSDTDLANGNYEKIFNDNKDFFKKLVEEAGVDVEALQAKASAIMAAEASSVEEDLSNETPNSLAGYLAKPGYEDSGLSVSDELYSPALPAPSRSSELGGALYKAKKLSALDLAVETCDCPEGFDIIRVSSNIAKEAERQGLGVDMGRSRSHTGQNLFAIESAEGVYNPVPERNYGVAQGSLSPTPITLAANVEVTPEGTLTRGAFTPLYG